MRKALALMLAFVSAFVSFASCQKQDVEKDRAAVQTLVEGDTATTVRL